MNRNHLSSGLRRMELETIMPTAQQATLLRSAQVISIRFIYCSNVVTQGEDSILPCKTVLALLSYTKL